MAEILEESQGLESTTVAIGRTATVVKGGRRFSFSAMVVVGDRRGSVGIGYGKAPGVPTAIEKAQKDAKKRLSKVTLKGGTIPHTVYGKFGASSVRLVPAAPGTGISAGGTVRAVLEMVGVHDCLSKAYGSTNQQNLCKAVIAGLLSLRTKESIAELRGVAIESSIVEEKLSIGAKYLPQRSSTTVKAKGPVNTVGQQKGGPGGGRGRRRRSDQEQEGGQSAGGAAPAPAPAPAPEAPKQ